MGERGDPDTSHPPRGRRLVQSRGMAPDTTATSHPLGMSPVTLLDGRFELGQVVGAGGMGVVHRGVDRETGRPVAVKRLLRSDASSARRFFDEARVLESLRHPGIVGHVAHGVTPDGQPWLAMEWVPGVTLACRLERGPVAPDDVGRLGALLCDALAWAHGSGVVHRDLKPSNVLLADDRLDRPLLIDFGIARVANRATSLTRTGQAVGTPGYMAPEQIRGIDTIDGRADLFALGCVLWECLTGRPAFRGADALAVLGRILFDAPRRDVAPEPLSTVVESLLAKAREARPACAADVAARLRSFGPLSPVAAPLEEVLTTAEQRVVAVIAALPPEEEQGPADETLIVAPPGARLADVAAAHGALLEALVAGPALALVAGDHAPADLAYRAGRCADALARAVPGWRVALAIGRAHVAGGAPAGEVVDRAASLAAGAVPAEQGGAVAMDGETRRLLDEHLQVSAPEPGVGNGEGAVLGVSTPLLGRAKELALIGAALDQCIEERAPAAVLLVGDAGIGKTRLCREVVARFAAAQGVTVVAGRGAPLGGGPYALLEPSLPAGALPPSFRRPAAAPAPQDTGAAAEAAREAVAGWLGGLARERGALLVLEDLHWADGASIQAVDRALDTLRDAPLLVLATARPEVASRFPGLWADRALTTLQLAPVSRHAAERLVRAVVGDRLSDDRVAAVVEGAGGNPFMLEELVRAATRAPAHALPDTVLALVQQRLDEVPPEGRRVLRAASIFGPVFPRLGLAALLGTESRDLDGWLDRLGRAELVAGCGAGEHEFRHPLVRDAAYATLTEEDRQLGHRLAARWLGASGVARPGVLAAHLDAGGALAEAAALYVRAAEEVRLAGDWRAVLQAAERAVAIGAADVAAGARILAGEAWLALGDRARAVEQLDAAVSALAPVDPRWCKALARLIHARATEAQYERMHADAALLLSHVQEREELDDLEVWAIGGAALSLMSTSGQEVGSRLLDVAAAALERNPGVGLAARAAFHRAMGYRALTDGALDLGLRHAVAAEEAASAAGDRYTALYARMAVGFFALHIGRFDKAEQVFLESGREAERLRLPLVAVASYENLGLVYGQQGRLQEAVAAIEESLRLEPPLRTEGSARTSLARLLCASGDLARAEAEALRAIELLETAPPLRPQAVAVLASVHLAAGRVDRALETATTAMDELRALGGRVEEGEALIRLTHARALAAAGHGSRAAQAVADARAWLEQRAARIGDPAQRQAFLTQIREHAALMGASPHI